MNRKTKPFEYPDAEEKAQKPFSANRISCLRMRSGGLA